MNTSYLALLDAFAAISPFTASLATACSVLSGLEPNGNREDGTTTALTASGPIV